MLSCDTGIGDIVAAVRSSHAAGMMNNWLLQYSCEREIEREQRHTTALEHKMGEIASYYGVLQ